MPRPIEIGPEDRVFVLTGAGISAESGIPTFRDLGGLWDQYRLEEVASPEAWRRDPELVWRFYSERRERAAPCEPNPGHRAVAELEQALGDRLFLCTQNVDGLHEQAGTRRVVHVHGELFKSRCSRDACDAPPFEDRATYSPGALPRCPSCGALQRPHIVWFGETLMHMDVIERELARATVFVAIGTSGVVWPAAAFVQTVRAKRPDAVTVYVGPEPPENRRWFSELVVGKAGETLPGLFRVAP